MASRVVGFNVARIVLLAYRQSAAPDETLDSWFHRHIPYNASDPRWGPRRQALLAQARQLLAEAN